jgi:hypothetical protein
MATELLVSPSHDEEAIVAPGLGGGRISTNCIIYVFIKLYGISLEKIMDECNDA